MAIEGRGGAGRCRADDVPAGEVDGLGSAATDGGDEDWAVGVAVGAVRGDGIVVRCSDCAVEGVLLPGCSRVTIAGDLASFGASATGPSARGRRKGAS